MVPTPRADVHLVLERRHRFDDDPEHVPLGMYQRYINIKYGLWYARSMEIRHGEVFQTLAKTRSIGGHIFVWGGLMPIVYFVISRWFYMKPVTLFHKLDTTS